MLVKNTIKFFLVGALLVSCSLNRDTSDVTTLFSDEDGVYSKIIKEFGFKLIPYNSCKMAMINYGGAINDLSEVRRDSIFKEYDNYVCFLLEIDIKGFKGEMTDYDLPGKEVDYDDKVNYYLFGMQKDIKLKDAKGNEYPCIIYYHERLNELSKANRFLVGFNKPNSDEIFFEYENPFINCGKVKFNIEKQHLALK